MPFIHRFAVVATALAGAVACLHAQRPNAEQVDRAHRILAQAREDLKKYYYDSTFGGQDLDARYRAVDASLDSQPTVQHLFGAIAQFFFDLGDSHTVFHPPSRAATVQYGFGWRVVGDKFFVAWVTNGSDAAKKGLAVGDEVVSVDGIPGIRRNRYLIPYLYYSLSPRPGMRLVVRKPDGTEQQLDVMAKVTPRQRVIDLTSQQVISVLIEEDQQALAQRRHRWTSLGDTALVWTFPSFAVTDDVAISEMMARARRHRALILDLRGNGGGAVVTMLHLLGHFFDRETRIATLRFRDSTEYEVAQPVGPAPFTGTCIVLIDAGSASASEATARTLQLEGKATVVGDRSAGALMTSITFRHSLGHDKRLTYAFQITVQDVILNDGMRREVIGVEPEFYVLPTGADLAAGRDPQMAKALALVGITRTPEAAAKLYDRR